MSKLLTKYETENCMGDVWHNQMLIQLFSDIDKRSKYYKKVLQCLENITINSKQRWIHNCITKTEIRMLNSMMKSKTEQTFQKRLRKYIWHYLDKVYGSLLYKTTIDEFSKLLDKPIKTVSRIEVMNNMIMNM